MGKALSLGLMALEPRLMFDGAAMADIAETAASGEEADNGRDANTDTPTTDEPSQGPDAPADASGGGTQIAIIDGGIDDVESILSAIPPETEVFMLDPSRDGVAQISDILADQSDLATVHLFSHGDVGAINIGASTLDSSTLGAYESDVASWGQALSAEGDILLYGCSVGADGAGQTFIADLAAITQADIAASDDATGSQVLGGDWDLEENSGTIQSSTISADAFEGLLFDGTLVAGNNLISGLGGADGYGETTLAKSFNADTATTSGTLDDGYWNVDVSSVFDAGFKLGDTTYDGATDFYVGTNGYVTLGHGNRSYSGVSIETYTNGPMFAAFLTDIDLRDRSGIHADWGDEINAVYIDNDTTTDIVTITYFDLAPHNEAIDREAREGNDFQIRLHDYGSGNFGVEFRYADIQWSGNATNYAEAGWTVGDAETYGQVTGSKTTAAKTFDTATLTTDTGHAAVGVWAWDVYGGVVGGPQTSSTDTEPVQSSSPAPTAAPAPAPPPPAPAPLPPAAPVVTAIGGDDAGPPPGVVTMVRSGDVGPPPGIVTAVRSEAPVAGTAGDAFGAGFGDGANAGFGVGADFGAGETLFGEDGLPAPTAAQENGAEPGPAPAIAPEAAPADGADDNAAQPETPDAETNDDGPPGPEASAPENPNGVREQAVAMTDSLVPGGLSGDAFQGPAFQGSAPTEAINGRPGLNEQLAIERNLGALARQAALADAIAGLAARG